jgi:hypothetical protein
MARGLIFTPLVYEFAPARTPELTLGQNRLSILNPPNCKLVCSSALLDGAWAVILSVDAGLSISLYASHVSLEQSPARPRILLPFPMKPKYGTNPVRMGSCVYFESKFTKMGLLLLKKVSVHYNQIHGIISKIAGLRWNIEQV